MALPFFSQFRTHQADNLFYQPIKMAVVYNVVDAHHIWQLSYPYSGMGALASHNALINLSFQRTEMLLEMCHWVGA
jgi:hypothetical protein